MDVRALIRNGWWVVAAATAVSLAVIVPLLAPRGSITPTDDEFDLTDTLVPVDHIISSGMARDGLRAIDEPRLLTPAEVERTNEEQRGKLLVPSDRVVGVVIAGDARAYPLRLMRWHEVVNDTVGGEPVAVTYNGLSDSVVVVSRRFGDDTLTFGVSGMLLNSNLLMYERDAHGERPSLWSQLQARAVAGPAAADRRTLTVLPAAVTTWQQWRRRHPDTRVLAPLADMSRHYRRDPYHSYFGSDLLRFPVQPLPPDTGLRLKDRVVAVGVNGTTAVFALPHLARMAGAPSGAWRTEVAGTPLEISFDRDAGTALVETVDGDEHRLEVRHAFWFAWHAAFPAIMPEALNVER